MTFIFSKFDEVHDGGAEALPCKVAAGAETADEHGGEALERTIGAHHRLVTQVGIFEELLLVFVGDAVGQTDAVVGKRKGGDDGVGLAFETEKICLAEQLALVDKTVVGEELVKVSFATTERLTLGKFLFRGTHKVTPC